MHVTVLKVSEKLIVISRYTLHDNIYNRVQQMFLYDVIHNYYRVLLNQLSVTLSITRAVKILFNLQQHHNIWPITDRWHFLVSVLLFVQKMKLCLQIWRLTILWWAIKNYSCAHCLCCRSSRVKDKWCGWINNNVVYLYLTACHGNGLETSLCVCSEICSLCM